MYTLKHYAFLFALLVALSAYGQQKTSSDTIHLSLTTSSLKDQFNYVIKKSNRYNDGRFIYKVVKKDWLFALQKHTLDSLKVVQNKYHSSLTTIQKQEEKITLLNTELSTTKTNIIQLNKVKDAFSLFGINMSKTAYNSLLWTIIAGLLAAMLFFVFKFKDSHVITKTTKQHLSELETEFEEHRRKALEREQKIMRKLQDEINKQRKEN